MTCADSKDCQYAEYSLDNTRNGGLPVLHNVTLDDSE